VAEPLVSLRQEEQARAALRQSLGAFSVEPGEQEPRGVPVLVVRPLPAASA
jgi:hypothetical protein